MCPHGGLTLCGGRGGGGTELQQKYTGWLLWRMPAKDRRHSVAQYQFQDAADPELHVDSLHSMHWLK